MAISILIQMTVYKLFEVLIQKTAFEKLFLKLKYELNLPDTPQHRQKYYIFIGDGGISQIGHRQIESDCTVN